MMTWCWLFPFLRVCRLQLDFASTDLAGRPTWTWLREQRGHLWNSHRSGFLHWSESVLRSSQMIHVKVRNDSCFRSSSCQSVILKNITCVATATAGTQMSTGMLEGAWRQTSCWTAPTTTREVNEHTAKCPPLKSSIKKDFSFVLSLFKVGPTC